MKMITMRIQLENAHIPVSRRIQIASTQTLWNLHHVIQIAMGWEHCHPYEFIIKRIHYGETSQEIDDLFDFLGATKLRDVSEVILSEVIHSRSRFLYVYDFGNDWRHIVKVEKLAEIEDPTALATIIGGTGNCPPEDIGGVWGYRRLLELQQQGARNSDDADFLDMLPEGFDPEEFDLEAAQNRLKKFLTPAFPRPQA